MGRVYDDCAKDPMDPTGGLGRHSDIIGSMSKAADETAEVKLINIYIYNKGSSVPIETICKSKEGFVDDGKEKKYVLNC